MIVLLVLAAFKPADAASLSVDMGKGSTGSVSGLIFISDMH